jgi:hypothetical protein
VTVVSVVSLMPFPALCAEKIGEPYRLVQISEHNPRQGNRKLGSDLIAPTRPVNKIEDTKTTRLRDLFPKDISEKLGTSPKSNNLSFEPWVPGRGAVGVRLEVTW